MRTYAILYKMAKSACGYIILPNSRYEQKFIKVYIVLAHTVWWIKRKSFENVALSRTKLLSI